MTVVKIIIVEYDPTLRRYRAICPECGYASIRAKREAAHHVVSQHVSYVHGLESR